MSIMTKKDLTEYETFSRSRYKNYDILVRKPKGHSDNEQIVIVLSPYEPRNDPFFFFYADNHPSYLRVAQEFIEQWDGNPAKQRFNDLTYRLWLPEHGPLFKTKVQLYANVSMNLRAYRAKNELVSDSLALSSVAAFQLIIDGYMEDFPDFTRACFANKIIAQDIIAQDIVDTRTTFEPTSELRTRPINLFLDYFQTDRGDPYPEDTKKIKKMFEELVEKLDPLLNDNEEANAGYRKLMEARDCFVRAGFYKV